MRRRRFLKLLSAASVPALTGCALTRIDPMHFLIRSEVITSLEDEAEILKRAHWEWSDDQRIPVLFVKGSPYERGYQQGKLLRHQIKDNMGTLYNRARTYFRSEEIFAEVFERIRPHIPAEYLEEMHGLAHGSRMPLHIIHAVHALPSMTEWGGKKRIKEVVKKMMSGEIGTSCSNFSAWGGATADSKMYVVRILDWGLHRISKLHEHPLITVSVPDRGIPNVNIGWIGFIGAISGMNAEGITLGEMGYGDPPNETLHGKPMPFLLRDVLSYARNLKDVRQIISNSPGDMSFIYLMSDGKTGEAEMYIRDRERFLVFKPGDEIVDRDKTVPPIKNTIYGGHYLDRMQQSLTAMSGQLTPQTIIRDVIPKMVMPSNFQNVVYDPKGLQFWVSNAKSSSERAAEQPYTHFDFARALKTIQQP